MGIRDGVVENTWGGSAADGDTSGVRDIVGDT